jgi:hypothetical protein
MGTQKIKGYLAKIALAASLISASPADISMSSPTPIKLNEVMSISALDFERMKGLGFYYGDPKTYQTIDKLIQKHLKPKNVDSIISNEKTELISLIENYSNNPVSKDFPNIYSRIDSLNNSIERKKASINYTLLKDGNACYIVDNNYAYRLTNEQYYALFRYKRMIDKLQCMMRFSREKYVACNTLLHCSPILPLLAKVNIDEIPYEEIFTILAKESNGIEYIVGSKGEIGAFQLNPPSIIFNYNVLKRSKRDRAYARELGIDSLGATEFKKSLVSDPHKQVVFALYMINNLKKQTKNEQHLAILYNIGGFHFSFMPTRLRKKIESGSLTNPEDIKDKYARFTGMPYLKDYLLKEKQFIEIEAMLRN